MTPTQFIKWNRIGCDIFLFNREVLSGFNGLLHIWWCRWCLRVNKTRDQFGYSGIHIMYCVRMIIIIRMIHTVLYEVTYRFAV